MKKSTNFSFFLFSFLFYLFTSFGALFAQTATPPAAGDGSQGNPYQIATLDNLYWLSQTSTVWDKHFIQTADIDASATAGWDGGAGFSPIGNASDEFSGSYNGDGHMISGLTINRPESSCVGLFGLTFNSAIQDVGLLNVSITGRLFVGSLVGYNNVNSLVSNSYSIGSVLGIESQVGGLLGRNSSSSVVRNSYSTGSVSGSSSVGGLVGLNYDSGSVNNSYSTGSVSGSSSVGGLVGYNYYNSAVSNSYSIGSVTGSSVVGGLVGFNHSYSTVSNSYSTGSVSGSSSVGGLVGANYYSSAVFNSFWDTETSGQSISAGGIGRTSSEMKTLSTFTTAGWDFAGEIANGTEDFWDLDPSQAKNNGYPYFGWQYPPCSDEDGDGYLNADCGGDDCDDSNDMVYPVAAEDPCNGIDDNCDGQIDETNVPPVAICHPYLTVGLYEDGKAPIAINNINAGSYDDCNLFDLSIDKPEVTCEDVGNIMITLTVTDERGQMSTCSIPVNVQDNFPPVAICEDITIELSPSGITPILPEDIDNGSNDACGIKLLELDIEEFTCEDVGENPVVLTVTDENGNTSTCESTVTVVDTEPPIAICEDITLEVPPSGIISILPEDIDNGSNDACEIKLLELDIEEFTCEDVGENPVVLTVTDENGNTSTCEATVTVVDPITPILILAPDIKIWPPDYNYQTFTLDNMISEVSDNCDLGLENAWIVFASSDEPEDAPGTYDGATFDDIVISEDCRSVQVRRERNTYGNGRVYTITLAVEDAGGNVTYADYQISVPRWPWGWYSIAVDDGTAYSVNCSGSGGSATVAENQPHTIFTLGENGLNTSAGLQIYPNPFRDEAMIEFYLPESGQTKLQIFNLQGQMVRQLQNSPLIAGEYQIRWDGSANSGQILPSGMYLIRLTLGEAVIVKKVTLQKY